MVLVLIRQLINIKLFLEIINGAQPLNIPAIIIPCRNLHRLWLIDIIGIANQLQQNILQGNKANDTAVLVQHRRLVNAGLLELLQHPEAFHRARDEHRLPDKLAQVQGLIIQCRIKNILDVDDAAEIIQAFLAHRDNRLRGGTDNGQILLQGILQINPHHLGSRCHQGICRLVAHVEHPVHQALLLFLKGTILSCLLD